MYLCRPTVADPFRRSRTKLDFAANRGEEVIARVRAVEHVRRMRGGSQAQLLRCSDGGHYVVKFQNNPQGLRILANELLAALLAEKLGLPVPGSAIVDVPPDLVRDTAELVVDRGWQRVPCRPGLCFGSRWGANQASPNGVGDLYDFLSPDQFKTVENLSDFLGMLVFDKWTGNADDRQAIFVRSNRASPFRTFMTDNGLCFNGSKWDFSAGPKYGLYWGGGIYARATGLDAFELWLGRLEHDIDLSVITSAAQEIPPEWYGSRHDSLARFLTNLDERRKQVRDLLWLTRNAISNFFPAWVCRDGEQSSSPYALESTSWFSAMRKIKGKQARPPANKIDRGTRKPGLSPHAGVGATTQLSLNL